MKKMASICLFIVTILSFLVTINLYQSKDYEQVMKMGQTTNSFNFYIQNSDMTPNEEISLFKHLSHKYDASFILTTTGQNGIIEKAIATAQKGKGQITDNDHGNQVRNQNNGLINLLFQR